MRSTRTDVRDVITITHVSHSKTALVDQLLRQSGMFRANQGVMGHAVDSNDIKGERDVTVLSKNTAASYDDVKINIIGIPEHADLDDEVERALKMMSGVVFVVDAFEDTTPQIRFVLKKALELPLNVVVYVDKYDRPGARPGEVVDEMLELLMDLDVTDQQLECLFIFTSVHGGWARTSVDSDNANMKPSFEIIISHIPAPEGDPGVPIQILVSTISYNEYVGRIDVDKIDSGSTHASRGVAVVDHHELDKLCRVKTGKLYEYEGSNRTGVKEAEFGSIVVVSGISDLRINDTIASPESPEPILLQKISEPTISMNFMVNDSPLVGQEGQYIASRHLCDRLFRELNTDVSLRVGELTPDCSKVSGCGELHLSVLIENVRREDFELTISKAEVIYHHDERSKRQELMEIALVDVPGGFTGAVIQKLAPRRGELIGMAPIHSNSTRLESDIPSRSLIGYRGELPADTRGNGTLNTELRGHGPYKGDMFYRKTSSTIAYESDEAVTYGLFQAQERGQLFVGAGVRAYAGVVIDQSGKSEDVEVNVYKTKKLTNTRVSDSDDTLGLATSEVMSLEQCPEFIDTDRLLEVTPENLRI